MPTLPMPFMVSCSRSYLRSLRSKSSLALPSWNTVTRQKTCVKSVRNLALARSWKVMCRELEIQFA